MENLRMARKATLVTIACIFVLLQSALLPPVVAVKSGLRSAHTTATTTTTTSSNDIIDNLVLLRKRELPAPYRRLGPVKKKTPKVYDDDDVVEVEYGDDHHEYGDPIIPDDHGVDEHDISPPMTKQPTQMPTFSATVTPFPSHSPPPLLNTPPSTSTTTDGGDGNDDLDNNSTDASLAKTQLISLPLLSYTISVTSSSSSSSSATANGSDSTSSSLSALEVVKAAESVFVSGLSLAFRNVVRVELEATILHDNDDDRRTKRGLLHAPLPKQQQSTWSLFIRSLIPAVQQPSATTSSTVEGDDDGDSSNSSTTGTGSSMTLVMEIVGDVDFESQESDQSDVPSLTTLQSAQRALLLNATALENDLEAALLQNNAGANDVSSSASNMILKVNYIKVSDSGGSGTTTIKDGSNARSPGDNEEITSTDKTNAADHNNTTIVAVALTASSMVLVAAGLLIFQRKRQREVDSDSNSLHSAVLSDDASSSSAVASHTSSLTYPSAFPLCAKPPNEREQDDNKKQPRRFEGHASSFPAPKTSAKTKDENRRSERKTASVPSDISVSSSEGSATEEHVNPRTISMPPSGGTGGNNSGQRPSRSARRSSRRRRRRASSAGSHHSMSSAGNCTLTSVVEEEEAEEVVVDAQDEQIEMYSPPDPPEDGRPEEPSSPDPPSTNAIQATMTTSLAAAAAQRSTPSPRSRETNVDVDESMDGPETPKMAATMSWGERVRSNVVEPAGFIYALADALTQSQQKTNGKAATPGMPKTPTRNIQWHSPQSKGTGGSSSGGREPPQEAPNSPFDEQEKDFCDALDAVCSPSSSPTDCDDDNPVLGRVSSLFTPYSTANANPQNREDDGNATDQSSGSSTAGDRLVKSIFKTKYFSKEQHHHAEGGFTTASSSESGALSPTLSPKRPSTLMILQQPLDNSYYMHSKALVDDESDDGAAAEDRALISPSLFLERSTGKTTNRRFMAVSSFAESSKGCTAAAAKSSKGCSAGESSKGSSSKSSKSMPTDEEDSYRNMDVVGFADPVVQATRSAQSNKNQQKQQASKKPAFPGYSRIWQGSKKAGGTSTSPSGIQNVMVYPDAVML